MAERLNSRTGRARNGLILGQVLELECDLEAARIAFETTIEMAESIGYASLASQATDALTRVGTHSGEAECRRQ